MVDAADDAVFQADDLVGLVGDRLFVRDADDRHAHVFVDAAQQVHHLLRGDAVQGARRFVGEDDFGPVDQRPGDRHTLFLAARHFVGHVCGPVPQSEHVEVFQRQGVAFAPCDALVVERQGDVLDGVLVVDQVERLEDVADHPVACGGGLRFVEVLDQAACEVVVPAVVVVEDAEDVQQGRFARSRGTHDRHQFAFADFEVDALQYVEGRTVVVGFVDVFEFYHTSAGRVRFAGVTVCYALRDKGNKEIVKNNLFLSKINKMLPPPDKGALTDRQRLCRVI